MTSKFVHPVPSPAPNNLPLGIVSILLAALCFALMDSIFTDLIRRDYPVFMLQGVRNWGCVVAIGAILIGRDGAKFNPLRQSAGLLLARGVLVYVTACLFFFSLKELDLGTVTTLLFVYPIVATAMAALFLGERIGLWRGGAIGLGFVGVAIAVSPGTAMFSGASLLPLLAGVFMAVSLVSVRWIPKSVSSLEVTFTAFLAMAVVGTPFLMFSWQPFDSINDIALVVGAVMLIIVGAQGLTIAFRVLPVALAGSLDYTAILFATACAYVFFGDVPSVNVWIAIPFIVGSGIVIAVREGRKSPK